VKSHLPKLTMTHTVEKIGGTCMSRARELVDTLYVGPFAPDAVYGRVFVVSAFGGITNMLLEHKKNRLARCVCTLCCR
jgi:aspartate kinase